MDLESWQTNVWIGSCELFFKTDIDNLSKTVPASH